MSEWMINLKYFCKQRPYQFCEKTLTEKDDENNKKDNKKLVKYSVHKGYYEYFSALRSQIISAVDKNCLKNERKKIIFAGHSLGGTVASFAFLDYLQSARANKFSVIECYTFGCPRFANVNFCINAESIVERSLSPKSKYLRFANSNDIVTLFPLLPTGSSKKYSHMGTLVPVNIEMHSISANHSIYFSYI